MGPSTGWPRPRSTVCSCGHAGPVIHDLPSGLQELAATQRGVLGRGQMLAAGLTDERIESHLRGRRWLRVGPGVYLTHTGRMDHDARVWAALTYVGRGAVASHETAAFLWRLCDEPPPCVHVSIPASRRVRSQPGLRLHLSGRIATARHPTRSPPRTRVDDTVLDLIDQADSVAVAVDWVTRACQRRRTTPARLRDRAADRSRLRWRRVVGDVLADVASGAETPLELTYVHEVERRHALPRARRQRHRWTGSASQWIDGDYEAYGTRVELDGRVGHVEDGALRDHRRDNLSTEEGYVTLRYGWAAVYGDGCSAACQVARVLLRRGWAGPPRPCGRDCAVHALLRPTTKTLPYQGTGESSRC